MELYCFVRQRGQYFELNHLPYSSEVLVRLSNYYDPSTKLLRKGFFFLIWNVIDTTEISTYSISFNWTKLLCPLKCIHDVTLNDWFMMYVPMIDSWQCMFFFNYIKEDPLQAKVCPFGICFQVTLFIHFSPIWYGSLVLHEGTQGF